MKWILFFVLTVVALFLTWRAIKQALRTGATRTAAVSPSVGGSVAREETHYSPLENLEALDSPAAPEICFVCSLWLGVSLG